MAINSESIRLAVEHAAHLLPAQGPITAFVHHNTLHAFEDLDFDSAVRKGAKLFGCHPYLPETHYRELLTTGRIRDEDIEAVLIDHLGDRADDLLGFLGTRFGLYRAVLRHSLHDGPSVDLRWVIGDTNALNRFREDAPEEIGKQFINDTRQWIMRDLRGLYRPQDDSGASARTSTALPDELQESYRQLFELFGGTGIEDWSAEKWESFVLHLLWKTCEYGASQSAESTVPDSAILQQRHRDLLQDLTCEDADELVDAILIPYCAAFLDQGFTNWQLADREQGFFKSFIALYGSRSVLVEPWRQGLAAELQRHVREDISPIESIRESLDQLGVTPDELESFIGGTLLALRGFAGMLWQLEVRGDRVSHAMPQGTLLEFLAIRLILDRFAVKHVAKSCADFDGELAAMRSWASERLQKRSCQRLLSSAKKRISGFSSFPSCLVGGPAASLRIHPPSGKGSSRRSCNLRELKGARFTTWRTSENTGTKRWMRF